ncbi:MAG TPA: permease [Anaerovoracaceae bacterium]|nr:permease [Anaerovoracaceae bacterium]
MHIPVYVVTGFLGAGKTALLNKVVNHWESQNVQMLALQFESGEETLSSHYGNCHIMTFTKKEFDQNPDHIAEQIHGCLLKNPPDEIWVEWNGMTPLSQLLALFQHPSLYRLCRFGKMVHIADGGMLESLLGKTGGTLTEQIANSDLVILRSAGSDKAYRRMERLIGSVNPSAKIYEPDQFEALLHQVFHKRMNPINAFCIGILLFIGLYLASASIFHIAQTPVNTIINIFLGIVLQAIPFLLIGVSISSAIQVFISRDAIERKFPKRLGWGMLAAILGGFCLPVCDCASIPIFRSLVRKGVPLPVAITFMTAAPVINPVVMLSTYYAFNGSLRIVAARIGLGILSAVLIGLYFAARPSRGKVLAGGADILMCSCGCYEGVQSVTTLSGKLGLFLRHSQAEFFNVGKYLMIGAFVASVFQTVMSKAISVQSSADFAVSLLVMMAMAFVLSLCSSSDAVVARSFASRFPMEAIMGFLVFGPMMDIKNVIMLSNGFSKRFIVRLLAVVFTVCFLVVFLLARPAIGR